MKEKTIIFYGKKFTPLASDCYGCYHFGTICEGAVYGGGACPVGTVEDIRPSFLAHLLLNQTNNRFILAKAFGYDLENDVQQEELVGNKKLLKEYEEALHTPDDIIEQYRKVYDLEKYSEQEIDAESPEGVFIPYQPIR